MKVGLTSLGMHGKPITEALQLMVQLGAECTELNGRPGVHPDLRWEPGDVQRVKKLLQEHGIVATSLGSYNDFAQWDREALEAQIAGFVAYCQRAADLEIPIARAFVADVKPGHTLADFHDKIYFGFEQIIQRTEGLGVRIGIENHGRLANDGDFLLALLQHIRSPRLGMTLDTGNFAHAGHPPEAVDRFTAQLFPYIINVHVKDGIWKGGGFELVPAGRGQIKLRKLLRDLAANGYQGAVVSEFEGKGDYVEGTRESVAYLRGLRDGVETA